MKLTYAIRNTLAGGTDAGSDVRLRRQMALLASLSPTVVGPRNAGTRTMITSAPSTWPSSSSACGAS